MGAAELLRQFREAGFTIDAADGKLLIAHGGRLTDKDREAVRANKPALLQLLLAERLTASINAAVLARGDTEANRQELLAEALALSQAHQLDLAEHFEQVARCWRAARRGVMP